jgi:hypothetical protein
LQLGSEERGSCQPASPPGFKSERNTEVRFRHVRWPTYQKHDWKRNSSNLSPSPKPSVLSKSDSQSDSGLVAKGCPHGVSLAPWQGLRLTSSGEEVAFGGPTCAIRSVSMVYPWGGQSSWALRRCAQPRARSCIRCRCHLLCLPAARRGSAEPCLPWRGAAAPSPVSTRVCSFAQVGASAARIPAGGRGVAR